MGEAKRKARHEAGRSWAEGSLEVFANETKCFSWNGTREDAIALQKRYLDTANRLGFDAQSHAKRAVGYRLVFGHPRPGEPKLMPNGFGTPWRVEEVGIDRSAVLWLALHEHIPNSGTRLEDVFVGKQLAVFFSGDRDTVLEATEREQRGQPFGKNEFEMKVGVVSDRYLLDPDQAVAILERDMLVLAKGRCPEGFVDKGEMIRVPRIPRDAAEADAMMGMFTILADAAQPVDDPKDAVRLYAGYTEAELLRGKTGVAIR